MKGEREQGRARSGLMGRRLLLVVLLADALWDGVVLDVDPSAPRGSASKGSVGSEPSVGKGGPDLARVVAAGEDLVGLDDGVSGVGEGGSARSSRSNTSASASIPIEEEE
jgi:hypothetical protein